MEYVSNEMLDLRIISPTDHLSAAVEDCSHAVRNRRAARVSFGSDVRLKRGHQSLEYRVNNKVLVYLGVSRPATGGPALSKAQRWGAWAVVIVVSVGGWILLKALL